MAGARTSPLPEGGGARSFGWRKSKRRLDLSPRGRGRRAAAGEGERREKVMSNPIARARRLRRDHTDVEQLLWSRLRNRQLDGWKFRRQEPVGCFVVDFLCVPPPN
ncbi:endonuclease domain-containing protein [Ancylobacter oerskovii]|uniref:Endonuclease domain-containing protein n=1 Tax=Ancylobacter oerskovii TaxID=459519 RepID=A0ABW4YY99_9HYPH